MREKTTETGFDMDLASCRPSTGGGFSDTDSSAVPVPDVCFDALVRNQVVKLSRMSDFTCPTLR